MPLPHLGFCGLGAMGRRMALTMKNKGHQVTVWNRSPGPAEVLRTQGLEVASTPAALAAAVDVMCTCVTDEAALEAVATGPRGLLEGSRAGQLFIDFSTVSVGAVTRLEAAFAARGVDFTDAPVTGSIGGAEKGTLVVMCGASASTLQRAQPVFAAVAEKVVHCGPVGTGTQVKLAGNVIIAAMLQSFCEGLLLTSKAGIDAAKLLEVVQASGYRSPYFDFKGKAVLAHDFTTHFSIDLMHKDLSLFLDSAAAHRVPTPTAASLRETYNLARASGKGDLDISGVVSTFEALAGHRIS